MFFYATKEKFKFNLKMHNLLEENNPKWVKQVAQWVEDKWGYIRGFPGMEYRVNAIKEIQNNFFIVTYANQPIGMFALFDYHGMGKIQAKELMYVYVEESFRGLGIGKTIIELAKIKCKEQKKEMMLFDTLNPNLNHFYEKLGAKSICESQFMVDKGKRRYPTTCLRLSVK